MDIVKENYKTDENLKKRISLHEKYSTNPMGFATWIVSNYQIPSNCRILELGCGNGLLWKENLNRIKNCQLVLTDFSEGMIDAARKNLGEHSNITYRTVDIQEIPFENQTFDLIIANQMLYHVPDIKKALAQVYRVLKPDGVFYCTTYGEHGQVEYFAHLLRPYGVEDKLNKRFTLQNGEKMLKNQFSVVNRVDYEDSFAVTDVEDLVTYMRTMTSMTNVKEVPFDQLTGILQQQMVDGVIRIPKEYGMFICRK